MVLAIFSAALFTSAILLFGIQPLYAKLVLPKLGGSPAVWSVALVFFQSVLLLGYAYSHFLVAKLKRRHAAVLHFSVLFAALAWLPISYPAGWTELPRSGETSWVFAVFLAGVGVPFFAVSANAPLMQSWFSLSGHPHASDPYFLYGASNIGSLLALLSYPFILEPLLSVQHQSTIWTGGYVLLCFLILFCWLLVKKSPGTDPHFLEALRKPKHTSRPNAGLRVTWAALAMVPSGLLVSVSTFITTDLAAVPFLWVTPLALFLVTFIITFSRKPLIRHSHSLWLHSWIVAPVLPVIFLDWTGIYILPVHLAVFFISSMVCHGELIKRRPRIENLTEFYLWMSLGGVLGGSFSSLVAPKIFDSIVEYPVLLLAVFLCRGDFWKAVRYGRWRQGWSLVVLCLLFLAGLFGESEQFVSGLFLQYPTAFSVMLVFLAVYLIFGLFYSARYTVTQTGLVGIGLLLVPAFNVNELDQRILETERSFFGVSWVVSDADGKFHLLKHGTTLHGAEQRLDDLGRPLQGRPVPLTYYHKDSALVAAVQEVRKANGGALRNVALIGLGAGSMACHRLQGENWRYFEIDPVVIDIARDPVNFRFLSECGESAGIVVGDGRIMLEKEEDGKFDLIVLDAFSSDSIPVHLMTREAFEVYFDKLSSGGALVFHISNRYMELGSVIASTAAEHSSVTFISNLRDGLWIRDKSKKTTYALVAVVSENQEKLGDLPQSERWIKMNPHQYSEPWTDDYSNVLSAIYRKYSVGVLPDDGRN